jgi:hypothetical protein
VRMRDVFGSARRAEPSGPWSRYACARRYKARNMHNTAGAGKSRRGNVVGEIVHTNSGTFV